MSLDEYGRSMAAWPFDGWWQITTATYQLIESDFVCEPRGTVEIKGKGEMSTYLLLSENATAGIETDPRHDLCPQPSGGAG